jgi:hypothetical protein
MALENGMSQRSLSPDGFRLALLAAIAGSLGCPTGDDGARTAENTGAVTRALKECVPEQDHGYPGSGVVECKGDFLHRDQANECRPDLLRPGQPGYPASRLDAAVNSDCYTDADCRSGPTPFCVLYGDRLLCANGCRQDTDCARNELCLCGTGLAGKCVLADCRTDSDCPESALCTGPDDVGGLVPVHFACQQAADLCAGDADCSRDACHYSPASGHRSCVGPGPQPGSP